jgi:hypothetical protein
MLGFFAFWFFIGWIYSIVVVHHVAAAKGLDTVAWTFGAVFFGVFAMFGVIAMPAGSDALTRRRIANGKAKVCRQCDEAMRSMASICPHCGSKQSEG